MNARRLLSLAALVVLAACSGDAQPATPTPIAGKPSSAAADALQRLPVVTPPSSFDIRSWDIAPGGGRVAFVGPGLALYLADAPDFAPRLLAESPASEPRWSPDGRVVAYAAADGIRAVAPGGGGPVALSPPDDTWRTRIVRVLRWLDDETLAYEAHCGTGCQYLFEMTVERDASGTPSAPARVSQVSFVRPCAACVTAGLAFHYSPDARYIAADYGGTPAVAWYNRATGEQWLVTFAGDAPGVMREFQAWDATGPGFRYREAPGETATATAHGIDAAWLCWHADPPTLTREPAPCGGLP